jgi:hypothetical protein
MRFIEPRPISNPDTAARKLLEIANAAEAVQDGRIFIERINGPFLAAGGTPDQFRAALDRTIAAGWWFAECGGVCLTGKSVGFFLTRCARKPPRSKNSLRAKSNFVRRFNLIWVVQSCPQK